MTVLVLGGYGAVGSGIVGGLRGDGRLALAAGRDPARADTVIDIADKDSYRQAIVDTDIVVNASGVEDPELARIATTAGLAFVDITATIGYVEALEQLDPPAPLLVSVGLAPGLTNLLAVAASNHVPGPIDLAVVLGAGDEHGLAATEWSLRLLGRSFTNPGTVDLIRNFTHPTSFDLPRYGRRRLYRADFSDQHTLSRDPQDPGEDLFRSRLQVGDHRSGCPDLAARCFPSACRCSFPRL